MKIIDPHLHFFNLKQGDYHWLKKENPPFWPDKSLINKDFSECDLILEKPFALAGFVHIEAGFDNKHPCREIAWLESSCKLPFKSIAKIDLTQNTADLTQQIEKLTQYSSMVGVRHILDDDANSILLNKNTLPNLTLLAQKNLIFELQTQLTNDKTLTVLQRILTKLPELTVIINHAGWPPYLPCPFQENNRGLNWRNGINWQNWRLALQTLSKFKRCAIKCSGWEMTNRKLDHKWQQEVIHTCLECFGDTRVMLASNFPLCLFQSSYQNTWQTNINLALNQTQLNALHYENALNWYKF